jgi:DNA-binding NtrC family response regulator
VSRTLVLKVLIRSGYECEAVQDGFEAGDRLAVESFDLLVSDVRMPGNHDYSLIRNLPPGAEDMPVLVMTADPSFEATAASAGLQIAGYLSKPFSASHLLQKVEECLLTGRRVERPISAEMITDLRVLQGELENELDEICIEDRDLLVALKRLATTVAVVVNASEHVPGGTPVDDLESLHQALATAVDVLNDPQSATGSETLSSLRLHLEAVLETI